jgi:hypothetical protein
MSLSSLLSKMTHKKLKLNKVQQKSFAHASKSICDKIHSRLLFLASVLHQFGDENGKYNIGKI